MLAGTVRSRASQQPPAAQGDHPARGRGRRATAVTATAGLVLAGLVPLAAPAAADPLGAVRGRIAQAQAQLQRLWGASEALAEDYNKAQIDLTTAAARSAAADARVAAADRRLAALRRAAGAMAASAYRGQSFTQFELLTSPAGPQDLVDRAAQMDAVARWQRDTLAQVGRARRQLAADKAAAHRAYADQRRLTDEVAARRGQILAAAATEQRLLGGLQSEERQLVRAAEIAAARAAAARKAAAEAAARKAAAEAAARAAALAAQRAAAARAAEQFRQQQLAIQQQREQVARAAQLQADQLRQAQLRQQQAAPPPAPAPPVAAPPAPAPPVAAPPVTPPPASSGAAIAVWWAEQELGKPYVFAAAGPDAFDCSGLTMFVWAKAGVTLQHYAPYQQTAGTPVSRDQLLPGDLVFFGTPTFAHHVGIYVGNGQMIDAPHTGAFVRYDSIDWPDYAGAVRLG